MSSVGWLPHHLWIAEAPAAFDLFNGFALLASSRHPGDPFMHVSDLSS